MRILKKFTLFLLAALGTLLIIAVFVDGNIKIQESIDIDAPVERVWNFTGSLSMLNTWNAWFEKDKMMKTSISGKDGHPGSKFCWDSEQPDLGKGCLVLSNLTTQRSIELGMLFDVPYKAQAKTYITLQPLGEVTRVKLNFNSEIPYPFRILKLFSETEKNIDDNYLLSLRMLKKLCEAP